MRYTQCTKIVTKVSANDIGGFSGETYYLDSSSYVWAAKVSGLPTKYSPAQQFAKFIHQSKNLLDTSSYAWILPSVTAGSSAISVQGGIQWLSIKGNPNSLTCVGLNASSYLWTWGANYQGGLGNGTVTSSLSSPVSVIGNRQFINFITSGSTTYALDSSSYLWAWGKNSGESSFPGGQLGDGTIINKSSPVSVIGNRQFIDLAVGIELDNNPTTSDMAYIVALDSSSYAWSWGVNWMGSLGDGTTTYRSSPVSVLSDRWKKLWGTGSSVYGEKENGDIYTWGINQYSNFGSDKYATVTAMSIPVIVNFPFKFIKLCSAGSDGVPQQNNRVAVCALTKNSEVWVWGNGTYLGDGFFVNAANPTRPKLNVEYTNLF